MTNVRSASLSDHLQPRSETASPIAWRGVVGAALLMLGTLPGRTQGLGLITEPLLADLHIDRTAFANLNLIATLLGALFCFPTGWLLDRTGLRRVTAVIAAILAVIVWQMSAMAGSVLMLAVLLTGSRAFGQSALSVCSITLAGRAAGRGIGMAMGVYAILLSVFFAMAFGVIGYSIRVHGWRTAWLLVAIGLVVVILPATWLLSQYGQTAEPTKATAAEDSVSHTLGEAVRTPAFWIFAGSGALFNLVSSGLGLFNEAVLAERGFDQNTYHLFLGVSTLLSLVGQFFCGWLSSRVSFQRLTTGALLLYALGLALIPVASSMLHLWVLALLLGTSGGMIIVIFFSIWSKAFGQKHLGRIQGIAQMLTVVSSALGPVLFARCFAATGSYRALLLALGVIVVAVGLLAWNLRLPNKLIEAK